MEPNASLAWWARVGLNLPCLCVGDSIITILRGAAKGSCLFLKSHFEKEMLHAELMDNESVDLLKKMKDPKDSY